MVVVDKFSKMAHCVACNKINFAKNEANLYFLENVCLHEIPHTIVSDLDTKYLSSFVKVDWYEARV